MNERTTDRREPRIRSRAALTGGGGSGATRNDRIEKAIREARNDCGDDQEGRGEAVGEERTADIAPIDPCAVCVSPSSSITVKFPAIIYRDDEVITGFFNERLCTACDQWFTIEFAFYIYKSEVNH